MQTTENLTWKRDGSSLWLTTAAGTRIGYVRHHARSTAKCPTFIGVTITRDPETGGSLGRQVTRTFGGEPTIAAAQAAVIKEIA